MSNPFVRSLGILSSTYGSTLNLPVGAANPGDVVVIYTENVDWAAINAGEPATPTGFIKLHSAQSANGSQSIFYGKVKGSGFGPTIPIIAGSGMHTGGSWFGFADVIGGVSWRTPGWIQSDGASGNYATFTRSDLSSAASIGVAVRVKFNELGVAQWMSGWASGDLGFGLNASNRPIIYANNTLGNPIGNVAANAAIPNLATGQRIWLLGQVVASTGNVQYHYSFNDVEEYDNVHWTELGTVQAGTNAGTTIRVTNSETVFVAARDASTTPLDGNVYALTQFRPGVAFDLVHNYSEVLAGGYAMVGTATHIRPTSDDGDGPPFDDWRLDTSIIFDEDNFYVPALDVEGDDRLAYNVWLGSKFGPPLVEGLGHIDSPISGPEGWDAYPDRAVTTHAWYNKFVTRTLVTGSNVPNTPANKIASYAFWSLGFTFRGRTDPVSFPSSPQPDNMRLGCAESYSVFITDGTYEDPIERIGWSRIQWGRVLDDISTADVTIPDQLGGLACLIPYGGVEPWRYGIRIERNDAEVWSGAIVRVSRQGKAIAVKAADKWCRYQKRFLTRQAADFIDTDVGIAFRQVLQIYAHVTTDSWTLEVPDITVNVPITRRLLEKEFKYAWDFMSECLNAAIDGYIMNGRLYLFEPNNGWMYHDVIKRSLDGPYNTNFDFVYGTFTEDAFSTRPDWDMDGAGQSNYNAVPSTDSGEFGFRSVEIVENVISQGIYGVLDGVHPEQLQLPQDAAPSTVSEALRARALTIDALHAYPPTVMEGGILSEVAPIDVDNLRPGSLWVTDVFDAGLGQLLSINRLRRFSVDVVVGDDGITERITPVLIPPGTEGEL